MVWGVDPRNYDITDMERVILEFVTDAHNRTRDIGGREYSQAWPSNYDLVWLAQRELRGADNDGHWPGDGFANKVKRAAANLVDRGLIVKRSKMNHGGQPGYANPEWALQYDADQERAKQTLQADNEASRDFEDRVDKFLADRGLERDAEGYRFLIQVIEFADSQGL